MEDRNIYQRMSAITDDLQVVAKNLTVGFGRNTYKAVSERDIIDTVKPYEVKHGIYSYPADREILESQTLTTETEKGTKTTFFTRIKTTYRFVNVDNPAEYIDMITFAEGIDPQDKGSGKAMTYCDKYALMKAYKISTGDDPDQQASEPVHYQRQQRADYQMQAPQRQAPKKGVLICENCKKEIAGRNIGGKEYSAESIARSASKSYGMKLCYDCAKQFKAAQGGNMEAPPTTAQNGAQATKAEGVENDTSKANSGAQTAQRAEKAHDNELEEFEQFDMRYAEGFR